MQLAPFLNKYDTILFDMDGVITSEDNYWTVSALTVWEWLYNGKYYGKEKFIASDFENNAKKIRKEVFCDDKTIKVLKCKGVNSNWDLGYIVFAAAKILDTHDFTKVLHFCEGLSDNILDEYSILGESLSQKLDCDGFRKGKLWNDMVLTFQEWLLGDKLFPKKYNRPPVNLGKKGYVFAEKPIIYGDILKEIFKKLSQSGKRLATATGRPSNELLPPIESFGIIDCFAKDGLINYDHIENAERVSNTNLTKPHPYIFIKAMLGEDYPDGKIIDGDFDKSLINKTLVVGDAGADILAARAMGADFCAVLTGVSGEDGREYFEGMKAEYILNSLKDFLV